MCYGFVVSYLSNKSNCYPALPEAWVPGDYIELLALPHTLLRGAMVNRTYGTQKKTYIYPFLLTIVGPIYYGPP